MGKVTRSKTAASPQPRPVPRHRTQLSSVGRRTVPLTCESLDECLGQGRVGGEPRVQEQVQKLVGQKLPDDRFVVEIFRGNL